VLSCFQVDKDEKVGQSSNLIGVWIDRIRRRNQKRREEGKK